MRYLIYAPGMDEREILHEAPVADTDRNYLSIAQEALKPLSEEQYMQGPAVLLQTFARASYILDGNSLYWCIEWSPGLLVVRIGPGRQMSWAAIRSPVPEFGGREPLQEDIDAYDDEAENHQYNLVFSAWDAQFDEKCRNWRGFHPADPSTAAARDKALQYVNELGAQLEERFSSTRQEWAAACKRNIAEFAGDGIRI